MNSVCTVHPAHTCEQQGWWRGDPSPQPEDSGQLLHLGNLSTILQDLAIIVSLLLKLFKNGIFSPDERHSAATAIEELLDLLMWAVRVSSTRDWKR